MPKTSAQLRLGAERLLIAAASWWCSPEGRRRRLERSELLQRAATMAEQREAREAASQATAVAKVVEAKATPTTTPAAGVA